MSCGSRPPGLDRALTPRPRFGELRLPAAMDLPSHPRHHLVRQLCLRPHLAGPGRLEVAARRLAVRHPLTAWRSLQPVGYGEGLPA
jgi:hypothetical protein